MQKASSTQAMDWLATLPESDANKLRSRLVSQIPPTAATQFVKENPSHPAAKWLDQIYR